MEYAKLGNTDIEVSKLCIGCMGNAGQFDRSTDACGKLILLLHQQACGLRADRARAQQSNANRRNIFLYQGILP